MSFPTQEKLSTSDSRAGQGDTYRTLRQSEVQRIGRFELLLRLGSGGMASLYLARLRGPEAFEKLVAIKKIHDHLTAETQFVDMFLDEARLSAAIQHPNVVQIYELGSVDGAYFIAMEYVRGHDLAAVLRMASQAERSKLTYHKVARILADASAGLHAAHELKGVRGQNLGIVHRDVSPHNLLLSYDGYVKVVDFGIAFAAEKIQQTSTGTLKGKLAYMSPEQARGEKVDRRTDVFALGIVLFEAVTGTRLFREDSEPATYRRVIAADVPPPSSLRPDIPPQLQEIILKALAPQREDRYQTAAELQEALEGYLMAEQARVGPAQLADLMNDLFRDVRLELEEKLQSLSETRSLSQMQVAPAMEGTGSNATLQSASAQISGQGESRPRRGIFLLALLGIGLASVALFFGLRHFGQASSVPPPASAPLAASVSTPDAAAPSPRSNRVVITFILTPKEAMLHLDGKERREDQGAFQRRIEVPRKESPISVRVSAPGHGDRMSEILPITHQTITINLVSIEEARPTGVARPSSRRIRTPVPGPRHGMLPSMPPPPQMTMPPPPQMTMDPSPPMPRGMRGRVVGDDVGLE